MLGLTSLLRLLKHHPAVVLSHLHPIIVALGQQIRNLRSQVARAACQASAEMFVSLKRNVEPVSKFLTCSILFFLIKTHILSFFFSV